MCNATLAAMMQRYAMRRLSTRLHTGWHRLGCCRLATPRLRRPPPRQLAHGTAAHAACRPGSPRAAGMPGVSISGNMTGACYTDPAAADCKAFQRTDIGAAGGEGVHTSGAAACWRSLLPAMVAHLPCTLQPGLHLLVPNSAPLCASLPAISREAGIWA